MADQIWDLIQRLAGKTEAGTLGWERTADDNVFQLSFPSYTVRIGLSDGNYEFQILDETGALIEAVSPQDLAQMNGTFDEYIRPTMKSLFTNARRLALGLSRAVGEIMKNLGDPTALDR